MQIKQGNVNGLAELLHSASTHSVVTTVVISKLAELQLAELKG